MHRIIKCLAGLLALHARAMLRMRISSILSRESAKKDSETVEPIRMPENTALNPQIYGVGAAERCRVALFPSLGGRVLLISREIVHWHRHKLAAVINGDPDAPTLKLSTRTISQERHRRPAAQNPHPSSTAVSTANRTPRSVVAQLRTSLQHLDRQNRPSTAAVAVDRSRKEPAPAPPHSGSRPGSCATRNHLKGRIESAPDRGMHGSFWYVREPFNASIAVLLVRASQVVLSSCLFLLWLPFPSCTCPRHRSRRVRAR